MAGRIQKKKKHKDTKKVAVTEHFVAANRLVRAERMKFEKKATAEFKRFFRDSLSLSLFLSLSLSRPLRRRSSRSSSALQVKIVFVAVVLAAVFFSFFKFSFVPVMFFFSFFLVYFFITKYESELSFLYAS